MYKEITKNAGWHPFHTVVILMALAVGCHRGDLGETCNQDGSCNFSNLECNWNKECHPKPKQAYEPPRCRFESECFCLTCSEKCAETGVKQCAFSDTSVWGSKPAVCECK